MIVTTASRLLVDDNSAKLGSILFAAAIIIFASAQISIASAVDGWWYDELLSLYSSDPSSTLREVGQRLKDEANPPLFFAALYCARSIISDEHTAVFAVNFTAILLAVLSVIVVSHRAGIPGRGLVAAAFLLLSGPIARYTYEARPYAMGMAIVFVMSWWCALAIQRMRPGPSLASLVAFGVLAALIHVYAAICCIGFGASMLALALYQRDQEMAAKGIALALAAGATGALWMIVGGGGLHTIEWITLDLKTVHVAAWYVKELAIGGRLNMALLAALLLFGLAHPSTRTLTITFGLAIGLFVAIPLLASLHRPIIGGRYWLIGAPALVTLLTMLATEWSSATNRFTRNVSQIAAICGAIVFFAASSIQGFTAAREITAAKPVWNGAAIVRPLIPDCASGSIRVFGDPTFLWGYAKLTNAPVAMFVDIQKPTTPAITPVDSACPVLGWAEHVNRGDNFMTTASDAALLELLKIRALPSDVKIVRHNSGFVVLRG